MTGVGGAVSVAHRNWTLLVLFVANVLSFIDRAAFTQLLIRIKIDLFLSDLQVGLLGGTAFSLAYMFLTIPASVLVEFVPNRATFLFFAICSWSVFSCSSSVKRFGFLFISRMGVGLGEASLSPTAYGLIADLFSLESRGRALGIYITASFVGVGISFFISSVVLRALWAPFNLKPWQFCFVSLGLIGFLFSFVICTIAEPRVSRKLPDVSSLFLSIVRQRRVLGLFLGAVFFFAVCMSSFGVFIIFFMKAQVNGLHESDAAFMLGVLESLLGLLGCLSGGLLNDQLEKRKIALGTNIALICFVSLYGLLSVIRCFVFDLFWTTWCAGGVFLLEGAVFTMLASVLQKMAPKNGKTLMSGIYMVRLFVFFFFSLLVSPSNLFFFFFCSSASFLLGFWLVPFALGCFLISCLQTILLHLCCSSLA